MALVSGISPSAAAPQRPLPAALQGLSLRGAQLGLDGEGALWWPEAATLVVSDLHLEKGSAYAARGELLPPYDTRATLARLAQLLDRYAPHRLITLGDTFHDDHALTRMAQGDRAHLATLVGRVRDWVWIAGNHDPAPPLGLGGRCVDTLALGSFVFRHEPAPSPAVGEVCGHLHPCARIRQRGRSLRRRCFVSDGRRLIMPAFGAYTGGLNVCDDAYAGLFGAPPIAYMLGVDRVWPVPARRLHPD